MISAGLLAPFAAVLAVSGAAKLLHPHSLAPALIALGLGVRHTGAAARLLGASEIAVGVLALVVGGHWPAGALAIAYAGLAAVSAVLVGRDDVVTCGCFGDESAPPSHVHTAADVVGATLAAIVAAGGAPSLGEVVIRAPLGGTLLGFQAALAAWLLLAVHRDLPRSAPVAALPFTLGDRR